MARLALLMLSLIHIFCGVFAQKGWRIVSEYGIIDVNISCSERLFAMGSVVLGAVFVDIKGYPLSAYIPGGRNAGRIEQVHGGVSRNVVEEDVYKRQVHTA